MNNCHITTIYTISKKTVIRIVYRVLRNWTDLRGTTFNGKKKRLLILIFVLILSGIVVIFIHKNGSMKGDSIMEENAISGDDNTNIRISSRFFLSIKSLPRKSVQFPKSKFKYRTYSFHGCSGICHYTKQKLWKSTPYFNGI